MRLSIFHFLIFAGWFPAICLAFRLYESKDAGRTSCFDRYRSLEDLERYADFIVTGTVERLAPSPNDYNLNVAVVRVRRIFKSRDSKKTRQSMLNSEANSRVAIVNIGDPNVCRTDVKEKDTKIFLLSSASTNLYNSDNAPSSMDYTSLPQYMLNSSAIPLTLRNLDAVEAIVKGKTHFFIILHV